MDLDEFEAPQSPEQAPPSPDYVPRPEYPEYVAPSDDEIPVEDQPLPADALPTALSPDYVADSDPLEEDPKEDPTDYPADGGDDDEEEEESSEDDDDEEKEASKEDKNEEEEHLTLADSAVLPAIDYVPSAEETKPFKTDESAATPPPPPQTIVPVSMTRLYKARIYVRPHTPPSPSTEALIAEYAYVPTPPSPPPSLLSPLASQLPRIPPPPLILPPLHTSPTYASAPLGYRAAMVQLRAASPSTYHLIHVPSPPLLLPSAAHRTDIPEAEMPPRKRTYFTAPASRFKVGESSTAAATGQTGHTLARRVDYGFLDTLDASIRVSEGRVMTTLEEVNERVTDLATTQRQDAHELYAWSRSKDKSTALEALIMTQEARTTALEAQVGTLQTQHDRIEWQRQEAGDMVTSAFRRIPALEARDPAHHNGVKDTASIAKMAPKKTTTLMTDAAIKQLIAQGVADALAEYKATRNSGNGDDSHDSGSGRRTECATRDALTWWNSHVKTVGHDAAYGMTWKILKKMMTGSYTQHFQELALMYGRMFPEESNKVEKYVGRLPDMIQGSVMTSKPKKMQDAIEFAIDLMDQKIRTFAERQVKNKRKLDDNSRNNHTQQQPHKRQNVAMAYTDGPGEKREYSGSLPLSPAATANNQRALGANQRVALALTGNGGALAKAYAVGNVGKNPDSNIVTGTFLLNNCYASILFDIGADKSFVSTAFSSLIDIVPSTLDHDYDVKLADGKLLELILSFGVAL
ncbi:hypothetical protein Tco_0492098 [Tanacetum coccineum]